MTTDADLPTLFRGVKGSRGRASVQPLACALIADPTEALPLGTVRLSWSDLLAARLRATARLAADGGEPEGKSLPYASLRAALQVQIPEAVLLARDLGAPWKKEERFPFLDVQAGFEPARDPVRLAAAALKTWMTMVLRPWADRVGIDDDLMDAVQDLATVDDAFEVTVLEADLGAQIRDGEGFDRLKNGILQVIAKRLEGQELFEGLGPAYRVIRGSSASNEISFQTWPATAEGARYSMVANLTVESGPFIGRPVVTVRASRRRWYDALPEAKRLSRLRTLTGTIMGTEGAPIAVEFTTPVRQGVPEEPFTPEFMIQALNLRQDLAVGFADMVARQGSRGVFVGIPYAPQLGGKHPVGAGATTRDQTDLFDVVCGLLAGDGFKPLPFRQTEVNKKIPKRAADHHKALQAEALIADIALALGRNHLDNEALLEACRTLMSDGEVPEIKPDTALKARSALEEVRAANRDRVRRAFGAAAPTVVVLGRTERERAVVRSVITGLFGAAVTLAEHALPDKVHGARADLPQADKKARERFAARVEAWTPLAEVIAKEHQGCHVLVQATDWYDRRKDDPVNKLAGRYALASRADANVQYLRPPAAGWRGLANYLQRVQAAVYDLLFGHSGLVSEVKSLLKGAFPKEATRPTAIIGISVVTQSRLRYGAGGGRLCLATRIDAESGRTTARVGWFNGVMRWSEHWEPFFEAMKRIADPAIMATLGNGRAVERDSFQKFVRAVVDGDVEAGGRPLVLIDSTSAAGLWPWLADTAIAGGITLGSERLDMAVRWPGVRLVRVRTGRAGRVVERKSARYERVDGGTGRATGFFVERYCPAITERTIRVSDSDDGRAAFYWVTRGYFQMSIPRGLSVYRNLVSFVPATKTKDLALPAGVEAKGLFAEHAFDIAKAPYRLPNAIDVTVAATLDGDDPDRIAHLVASLRCGYGHTASTTTLPAPLSFESKARDYMTRFVLDEADSAQALDVEDDGPFDGDGEDMDDLFEASDDLGAAAGDAGTADVLQDGCQEATGSDDEPEPPDDPGRPPGSGRNTLTPAAPVARSAAAGTAIQAVPGRTSSISADPVDRWASLIDRYGVARGERSRLIGSTSLSVRPVADPLAGKAVLVPAAVRPPVGMTVPLPEGSHQSHHKPRAAAPAAGAADAKEAPEAGARGRTLDAAAGSELGAEQEGETSMATPDTLAKLWPDTAREPVLPVPSFVTREWLTSKVSAPPSLLREVHKWRAEVQALSGFPWPKERPTPEQFFDMMLDGLRYPGFVRAVTRVAVRHIKVQKKREEGGLFKPFRNPLRFAVTAAAKALKQQHPTTAEGAIRVLFANGQTDIALSHMYVIALGFGYFESLMTVAKEFPEETAAIVPFLEAASKHLVGDFSWQRDIVEQRGVSLNPSTLEQPDVEDSPAGDGLADCSQGLRECDPPDGAVLDSAVAEDATQVPDMGEGVSMGHGNDQEAEAAPEQKNGQQAGEQVVNNTLQGPGQPMGAGDDRLAAAKADWSRILAEVSSLAAEAVDSEPDAHVAEVVLETLLAKLNAARAAARAWDEAKPKNVDPAPMIADASALAITLVEIAKLEAAALPDVALVTPEAAADAAAVLETVRTFAGQATALFAQAKNLSQDFDRIEEAAKAKIEGREAARNGLAALERFAAVLVDGAAFLPSAAAASVIPVQTAPQPAAPAAVSAEIAKTVSADDTDLDSVADVRQVEDGAVPKKTADAEPVAAPDPVDEVHETASATEMVVPARAKVEDTVATTAAPVATSDVDGFDDAALDLLIEVGEDRDADDQDQNDDGILEMPDAGQADAEVPAADEEADEDPFAQDVEAKLTALVTAGEFGLAYHLLRAAGRVFPDRRFPFTEPEIRLSAMAGHINHAALQGNEVLNRLVEEVRASVHALQSNPDQVPEDTAAARRIMLFGATATLALFHTDSVAGEVLDAINGVAPGLDECLYPLKDALIEASRSNVGLTPAMLRTISRAAEVDRYGTDCLKAVLEKIESFSQMRFRFQLGAKIRQTLIRNDGAIGKLKERLDKGEKAAVAAAREFADAYSDRSAILALLDAAEVASHNFKFQGIDGDARERLVANIDSLASRCREFVQAREAVPTMKSAGQRAIVTGIRASILAGLEKAVPTLGAYAEAADPLPAAAARHTLRLLERLRAAVDGELPQSGTTDHLLALHGPLLWLPGLRFGRSWLPSPYQPEIVVGAILSAAIPVVPTDESPIAALEGAVRQRRKEDSFVAARLLAEAGAFYGVTDAERGQLRDTIETNVQYRRDALVGDIAEVRRMVDRVQRMGMLRGVDDAQALLSLLDRIDPTALPTEVALDSRDEDEENELILDFASAEATLGDVRERVQRLLNKPRQDVLDRLASLVASGRVPPEDAERVRGLVAKDDLLTAGEYMGFLEDGRALPETTSPNPRFRAFYPAVTEALDRLPKREMEAINTTISAGHDLGPLAFSRIPENRREDALALLDDWKELRKRVQGGFLIDNVISLVGPFLERAGLRTELTRVDSALSSPKRKVYVAEMKLRIPTDAESVLLPDFGSQTGGHYRICLVAKMPSESELTSLCDGAGSMGVMVLVASTVDTERRRQLAWNCIDQNRRVLVVDEAIFLFALSEPEFRPLTMVECAQPFSFAAPYRDYGNQAVPPEMFFGRETEYRKLYEPSGSCIVYGGRRLGKTALLQHLKATKDDPDNGMAVAYVNILAIGNNVMPSLIWDYASRALPALFPEPVTTATDFTERVDAWLDADARRRVLVLFDESDRFIEDDAADKFREFIRLQALMDTTNRRFKFVLAGLHNVTRLVHTENPPLKQIASDPQRIGPLMDAELKDAELLVTQPLAAMGFEFENREDVWRILSHCNYYPVLVQTFCKGLLEDLAKEVVRKKRPVSVITGEHVRAALEDEKIAQEIGKMFDYTISEIEDRYALIANIMAMRALEDSAAGRVGEGMAAADVLKAAAEYWPAAFTEVNRLSVIEDLLDEMEGLGVLRRVGPDAWALRSHGILRLLGSDTKITTKLCEFIDRPAPAAFEPRSMRRPLSLPTLYKVPPGHFCPLTLGQEHDLLTSTPPGQVPVQIRVIFGNALADLAIVAAAMRTAGPLVSDGTRVEIVAQAWRSSSDLMDAVRPARSKDADLTLLVVDSRADWDGDWIEHALRSKPVRDGRVRLVFVGGPQHALRWVADPRFQPPPPQVRTMPLQAWTTQMIDHCLRSNDLSPEQYRAALRDMTGGFNRPLSQLLVGNVGPKDKFMGRVERQRDRLLGEKGLLSEIGLVAPMDEVFRRLPGWLDPGGHITAYEIAEGILPTVPSAEALTGLQVVEYGALMGLLEPEAVPRPGVAEDGRRYTLNPLLVTVLAAMQPVEVA